MAATLNRILDKMRDPAWLDRPLQQSTPEMSNEMQATGLMPEDQPLPAHAFEGIDASMEGPGYGGPGEEGGVPGESYLQKKLRMQRMMQAGNTELKPIPTLAQGGFGG